jgi:hypothetical protein
MSETHLGSSSDSPWSEVGRNWTVFLLLQGAISIYLFYGDHSYWPHFIELWLVSSAAWGLCNGKPEERLQFATFLLGWSIAVLLYKLYCFIFEAAGGGAEAAHVIHTIIHFLIIDTAWKGYQLARAERGTA